MTKRAEHYFGGLFDLLRPSPEDEYLNMPSPEDEYINLEIVSAKPRPKDAEEGTPLPIEQINREIREVRELLELEVMA